MKIKTTNVAKKYCANLNNGICSGVVIRSDLSQIACDDFAGKPCCVNEKRCPYFEKFIIPVAEKHISNTIEGELDTTSLEYYQKYVMDPDRKMRKCKSCRRLYLLKDKEQYCLQCKHKRNQKSWRESKRRLYIQK